MKRRQHPGGLAMRPVALAHQLLSPRTRTVLVTSPPLDPDLAHMGKLDAGATAPSIPVRTKTRPAARST